jgi:hypothetical protein
MIKPEAGVPGFHLSNLKKLQVFPSLLGASLFAVGHHD